MLPAESNSSSQISLAERMLPTESNSSSQNSLAETHKLVVVVWGWGLPWTPSLSAAALTLGDMHCPAHCLLSGLRQQAQCLTHHAAKARRLSMQLKPTLRRVRCLSVTVWHSTTSARRFILLMPAKASRRATMFTMLAGAALSSSEPSAAAQKHSMRSTNHIQ
jgi:hypothetical protein